MTKVSCQHTQIVTHLDLRLDASTTGRCTRARTTDQRQHETVAIIQAVPVTNNNSSFDHLQADSGPMPKRSRPVPRVPEGGEGQRGRKARKLAINQKEQQQGDKAMDSACCQRPPKRSPQAMYMPLESFHIVICTLGLKRKMFELSKYLLRSSG